MVSIRESMKTFRGVLRESKVDYVITSLRQSLGEGSNVGDPAIRIVHRSAQEHDRHISELFQKAFEISKRHETAANYHSSADPNTGRVTTIFFFTKRHAPKE